MTVGLTSPHCKGTVLRSEVPEWNIRAQSWGEYSSSSQKETEQKVLTNLTSLTWSWVES